MNLLEELIECLICVADHEDGSRQAPVSPIMQNRVHDLHADECLTCKSMFC